VKKGLISKALAYMEICHPFPLAMILLSTLILSLIAAKMIPPIEKLAIMLLAIACSQASINSLNDYFDREIDQKVKPHKPIPSERLNAGEVLRFSFGAFLIMCVLASLFGLLSLILVVIGTIAGFLYDTKLKRTIFSWLPFILAYPVLAIWVWVILASFNPVLLWLYLIGSSLFVGIHITNTLPDLELDKETIEQVQGLVHVIGKSRAISLCRFCFLISPLLAILISPVLKYNYSILFPFISISLFLTVISFLLYRRAQNSSMLIYIYRLLSVNALLFTTGWLAAVTF